MTIFAKSLFVGAASAFLLSACSQMPSDKIPDFEGKPAENLGKGEPAPTGPATTPTANSARLSGEKIKTTFSGMELYGCYVDNQRFGERLAADGSVYNLMDPDRPKTGTWSVANDQLCFSYPEINNGAPGCFAVVQTEKGYLFGDVTSGQAVAASYCPMTTEG